MIDSMPGLLHFLVSELLGSQRAHMRRVVEQLEAAMAELASRGRLVDVLRAKNEAMVQNNARLLEQLEKAEADLEALRAGKSKPCGCATDEGCDTCCPLPARVDDSEAGHCFPPEQLDEALNDVVALHERAYASEEDLVVPAATMRRALRFIVHNAHRPRAEQCPNCRLWEAEHGPEPTPTHDDKASNDESPAVAEVISVAYRDIACSGGDHGVAILDNPDHIKHFEAHQEVELRREGQAIGLLRVTQVDRERSFIRFEPDAYIERADRLRVARRVR